jgi:16S rRNA (guanine(527)-N(7))-methyltransferase RsmG
MWLSPSTLRDESRKAGRPLAAEQAERLSAYLCLVVEFNAQINLVSVVDEEELVRLHGLDFLPLLSDPGTEPLVDIGAGAGFVGIAEAICRPERTVILLEPNARRSFFLQQVRARLGLSVQIVQRDLEGALGALPGGDLLFTARALPKKERVFRRLGILRPFPHRLALFLGGDAEAFAAQMRVWYTVDRMIPLPFRTNGRLAFLRHVSRETWAGSSV